MSIGVGRSSARAPQVQEGARPRNPSMSSNPLDKPMFRVVETTQQKLLAKLDLNGDGGLDQVELKPLNRPDVGKNGPAGFAAADRDVDGAPSTGELAPGADMNAIFEIADSDGDGVLTLAEIEAQIVQEPDHYDSGVRRLPDALRPLDPSAPDYLDRVRDRLTAAASFEPVAPGQEALRRLLRENFARLTEQMVAQISPPRAALT